MPHAQREEIFKAQCTPQLLALLDRGQPEERFAACGVVFGLAHSEKHIAEVITNRVGARVGAGNTALAACTFLCCRDRTVVCCSPVEQAGSAHSTEEAARPGGCLHHACAHAKQWNFPCQVINGAVALLAGEHDRAKLPAAQLLAFLATRAEYSARVVAAGALEVGGPASSSGNGAGCLTCACAWWEVGSGKEGRCAKWRWSGWGPSSAHHDHTTTRPTPNHAHTPTPQRSRCWPPPAPAPCPAGAGRGCWRCTA